MRPAQFAPNTRRLARMTAPETRGADLLAPPAGTGRVPFLIDPIENPPNADLVNKFGAINCLRTGLLPWRRIGGRVIVLTHDPAQFAAHAEQLAAQFGRVRMARTSQARLQASVQRMADAHLAAHAEARTQAKESCRDMRPRAARRAGAVIALLFAACAILTPMATIIAISALATLCAASNSALKAAAALALLRRPMPESDQPLSPGGELPKISILVPLYREEHIATHLLERLKKLNYPRDKMDVLVVCERSDTVTQDCLARTPLPSWIRAITVPPGGCQTKPRALNYALDFTRGSIVGVYDAEDAPEPNQLLAVARRFAVAPPEVACLQGILDFYNTRSNWLSRCFTAEYAAWFRVVLPGIERLGLIIPLGGTTLFFRRDVLDHLGGWDAYNVTEDADLGVRLTRHGYRTEIIPTVTYEEANARTWPWIKQRSRWLKGYAMTYWVHMRSPLRLWRDLGTKRFLALQVQFGATLDGIFLIPVLWSFWLALFGLPHPFMSALGPVGIWIISLSFLSFEVLNITVAAIGVARSGHSHLMKWTPSLHFYHVLAAFACYKAFWELMHQPFYWDKTSHGIFTPERGKA